MNNWNAIKAFYKRHDAEIFSEPSNEWGIPAYSWCDVPGLAVMTPIEEWLWADIRENNAVLYPQYPVGRFFVDFANPVAKVAIECDGAAFHLDKAKDAARDAELQAMGWTIYRITGKDCRTEFDDETREYGAGYLFIEGICQRHGISRNSQPKRKTPKPVAFSAAEMMKEFFAREASAWGFQA